MEQWTEQTSLRLLDLIVTASADVPVASQPPAHVPARADSLSCEEPAEVCLLGNDAAVSEPLLALAATDPGFWGWLREHDPTLPTAASSVLACDWQRVAKRWIAWLAAEEIADAASSGAHTGLADASQAEAGSGPNAQRALLRRVLIASARAALRTQAALTERENERETIARELAYDMAYGLSHELNNPLANIATRARLLAEEESSERKRQLLSAIVDQAMRGCEMIADLMLIARPPATTLESVPLAALVGDVVAKARPWAEARGLGLRVHLPEQALTVETDRTAFAEALWAILRNAIEVARAQIVVSVSVVSPVEQRGECVSLAVEDDGPGISPYAQAHALSPFFSGREAGRGLGIGLAKADRIARLSGGQVTIAAAPGGGCRAVLTVLLSEQPRMP